MEDHGFTRITDPGFLRCSRGQVSVRCQYIPFSVTHHELAQRKLNSLSSKRIHWFEWRPQLYAEPSLILYIRTKFDLSNVVIVSPDAGGAKRCVICRRQWTVEGIHCS